MNQGMQKASRGWGWPRAYSQQMKRASVFRSQRADSGQHPEWTWKWLHPHSLLKGRQCCRRRDFCLWDSMLRAPAEPWCSWILDLQNCEIINVVLTADSVGICYHCSRKSYKYLVCPKNLVRSWENSSELHRLLSGPQAHPSPEMGRGHFFFNPVCQLSLKQVACWCVPQSAAVGQS